VADVSIAEKGYFSLDEVLALPGCPPPEAMRGRRVAVVECSHELPCNPCETACKTGAIKVGVPITNVPKLDAACCNGCGLCVVDCPGLAIFIVDLTRDDGPAELWLPHEFLPLPEKGEVVLLRDRAGAVVGEGDVTKVRQAKRYDRTTVVHVLMPEALAMIVRAIGLRR
jgi:Fe-S-cluster-containing hydrogenase component 2